MLMSFDGEVVTTSSSVEVANGENEFGGWGGELGFERFPYASAASLEGKNCWKGRGVYAKLELGGIGRIYTSSENLAL